MAKAAKPTRPRGARSGSADKTSAARKQAARTTGNPPPTGKRTRAAPSAEPKSATTQGPESKRLSGRKRGQAEADVGTAERDAIIADLRRELDAARARIADLEARQEASVNQIDWVLESLRSALQPLTGSASERPAKSTRRRKSS